MPPGIYSVVTSCAGGRHNMPPPPASWPLTLKVMFESRVTWATSVPILVFLGLFYHYYAPAPIGEGTMRQCCLTSVVYIGPKSRTNRLRKTKIGTEVAYITRLGHHFQGQKVKGQGHRGRGILWRPPAQLVNTDVKPLFFMQQPNITFIFFYLSSNLWLTKLSLCCLNASYHAPTP